MELLGFIEDYRWGLLPLIVPLTLLKHHLGRYPVPDWVHQQVYLHPHLKELMQRNHVWNRGYHNQTRVHALAVQQLAEAAPLVYNHSGVVQLYNSSSIGS